MAAEMGLNAKNGERERAACFMIIGKVWHEEQHASSSRTVLGMELAKRLTNEHPEICNRSKLTIDEIELLR